MNRKIIFGVIASAVCATTAHANLGGFEQEDGYKGFLGRVETYNAGQYGPNSGGGVYTSIATGTGLWVKDYGNEYATGHAGRDRTRSYVSGLPSEQQKQGLVITTNDAGWNGSAQKFTYSLDQYDLSMSPSAVSATAKVNFSIWSCPGILYNNSMTDDFYGNSIAFLDSSGNAGITIGYKMAKTTGVATIAYNVDGTWFDTGIAAATNYYQQWNVELDLATDTVSVNMVNGGYTYTNLATNTTSTKGPGGTIDLLSNVAMNQGMSDLTKLEFISSPGVTNSKQWQLDDVGIVVDQVPEPSSTALLGLGALGLLIRRKRA